MPDPFIFSTASNTQIVFFSPRFINPQAWNLSFSLFFYFSKYRLKINFLLISSFLILQNSKSLIYIYIILNRRTGGLKTAQKLINEQTVNTIEAEAKRRYPNIDESNISDRVFKKSDSIQDNPRHENSAVAKIFPPRSVIPPSPFRPIYIGSPSTRLISFVS